MPPSLLLEGVLFQVRIGFGLSITEVKNYREQVYPPSTSEEGRWDFRFWCLLRFAFAGFSFL